MTSCSQSEQQTSSAEPIVIENRVFFDNETSTHLNSTRRRTALYILVCRLKSCPNVDTNSLQQLLESIGDEADRISEKNSQTNFVSPQLLSRYKVFQTRLGIVRYRNPEQYTNSTFIKAMDDVVISWNIFADHYSPFFYNWRSSPSFGSTNR